MRSVVYRYDELRELREALDRARGQALPLPREVQVRDGEWVLALFELDETPRATAAAGKGAVLENGPALVFERRDWERLRQFAAASRSDAHPSQLARSGERLAQPAAVESLRRTMAWESSPVPSEAPDTTPEPTLVEPRPSAVAASEPRPLRGQGARILLVDDDPDLRDIVAAMLEAVGLAAASTGSAEEALELVRADAPDLLVLDWNLPGMSGLDLCKIVRSDAALVRIPVLFLTAHSATQDMVEAFAAGADDYVVKPFRAAELGARIFGLLRRTRAAAIGERT